MHIPRKHLSYANVTATLALVFAMSGGALAANHYLINSTKQINPKVLKKLKGNAGKNGKTGAAGASGAAGATGKEGPGGKEGKEGREGPFPSGPLPSGKTVRGTYQAMGSVTSLSTGATRVLSSISFGYELSTQLEPNVITSGGAATAACPGTADHPEAAPGNLCVYRESALESNVSTVELYTPTGGGNFGKTGFTGDIVDVTPTAINTTTQAGGTWAATAP